jgi:hypothetical protein
MIRQHRDEHASDCRRDTDPAVRALTRDGVRQEGRDYRGPGTTAKRRSGLSWQRSSSTCRQAYGMSKKYESAQITDMEGHHPEGYDLHRRDFLDTP